LLDRGAERAEIDELLELVRQGFSGVLVLRGGDGVGKTTLLGYAVAAASGFRISAVAGVESEINLPYSALHQLISPFLPLIDDLPVLQRQAIRVAFGPTAGPPPEGFLVGLGCLTRLSRAAADQPVLCAVDDAHWIDAESRRVLEFVARRLYADSIGIVLTYADTGEPSPFQPLRTISVAGLLADAAADLLRSIMATPLAPAVVDRVVADTERNPLALVEIGSHFTAEELAVRAYLPEPIPVGRQLQERFLREVHDLPADVQEFMLLAAADASGDRSRVRHAAADVGIDADAAETTAETAEMINVSDRVRFRHPLIRASVYHSASDASRRRAHHLLGQAVGGATNNDRRAAVPQPQHRGLPPGQGIQEARHPIPDPARAPAARQPVAQNRHNR
jgi:AAA ATPase domain